MIEDSNKHPRPSAWKNLKCLEWLLEHPVKDAKCEWVYKTFDTLMTSLDLQAEEDIIPASNICLTDKYKMRLYKAFFSEFRDLLICRNDSLRRSELDARNSASEATKPYHEIVCEKYNDENWKPMSSVFPLFHHSPQCALEIRAHM